MIVPRKKHGPHEPSIVVLLLIGGCIVLGIGMVGNVQMGGYGLPHKLMIGVGGAMIVWGGYRFLRAIGQESKAEGFCKTSRELIHAGVFMLGMGLLVLFLKLSDSSKSSWEDYLICGWCIVWGVRALGSGIHQKSREAAANESPALDEPPATDSESTEPGDE